MILLIYMKIHQKLYNTMSFTLVPIYFTFQQLIRCFGCPFNPHQLRFKFSNRSLTKLLDKMNKIMFSLKSSIRSLAITQIYNTTHPPPALRCHAPLITSLPLGTNVWHFNHCFYLQIIQNIKYHLFVQNQVLSCSNRFNDVEIPSGISDTSTLGCLQQTLYKHNT